MTNGEKIKEIFPNIIKYGNILIDDTGALQKNILFDDSWWNAEYKDPTTKKDCNTCTHNNETDGSYCYACVKDMCNNYDPTTKNNLGVDCVDRNELLKIYEDRFLELQKLKHLKDNKGANDRQLGVNYCINILKEMPPVTPQEPKTGQLTNSEWIDFLSEQFDISRTSAKEMLHVMMLVKKEDNFKKQFSGR